MKTLQEIIAANGVELREGTVGWNQGQRGKVLDGAEFCLKVCYEDEHGIHFYLHPTGRDGNTVNGVMKGNEIVLTNLV